MSERVHGVKSLNRTTAEALRMSKKKKVFIVALIFGIAFVGNMVLMALFTKDIYNPVDTKVKLITTKEKPLEGSAIDYSAIDNFYIAAGVIYDATDFKGESSGKVVANVMGGYTQTLSNARYKKNDMLFTETKSTSAFKKITEQKFISKNIFLYSKGTNGNISLMTEDDYSSAYGLIPKEICKYTINDEIITDSGFIGQENGIYEYYLTLEPSAATERYRHEVKTLGGAKNYPTFSSVKLNFKIDSDWLIQSITVFETYKIEIVGLGDMTCKAEITETFSHVNDTSMELPESANRFIEFVPGDGSVDPIAPSYDAADYLAEAFGEYLNGKAVNLYAETDILGYPLDFALSLDINKSEFAVCFSDELFIGLYNGEVYFNIKDIKGRIKLENLTSVLESLGVSVDVSSITGSINDGSLLETLFADMDMTETETEVHVIMPFNMFGIGFNVDIGMIKYGEVWTPDEIKAMIDLSQIEFIADLSLESNVILANITFDNNLKMPAFDNSYASFDKILDFISPVGKLINANGFNFDFNMTLSLNDGAPINLSGNVLMSVENQISLSVNLLVNNIPLQLIFIDNNIYVIAGNFKLLLDLNDIDSFIAALSPYLDIDTDALNQIFEITLTIENIAKLLNEVLGTVQSISFSDNAMSVAIFGRIENADGSYNDLEFVLKLTHFENGIGLRIENINIGGVHLGISLSAAALDIAPVLAIPQGEFLNLKELLVFIEPVMSLYNAKTYNLNARLSFGETELEMSAAVVRADDGIKLSANLKVLGISIDLSYDGSTVYAIAGNIKLSAGIDELTELIEKIIGLAGIENIELPDLGGIISGITFNGITDILSLIKVNDGRITMNIAAKDYGNIEIAVKLYDNGNLLSLSIGEISVLGTNLSVNANISGISGEVDASVGSAFNDTIPLKEFIFYIDPIAELIKSKSFTFGINGNLNIAAVAGILDSEISGELSLTLNENLENPVDLSANFSTIFGQSININFIKNQLFLKINDGIRVSLKTESISGIIDTINSALMGDLPPVVMPEINLSEFSLSSIMDMIAAVNLIKLNDGSNGIQISLATGSINFDVILSQKNILDVENSKTNAQLSLGVSFRVLGDDNSETLSGNLDIEVLGSSETAIPIEVPEKDSYVTFESLADFIQPVINTIQEEYFDVSFDGSVQAVSYDNPEKQAVKGETTYFEGTVKVVTTTAISNASFPEMEIVFKVGTNKKSYDHNVKLVLKKDAAKNDDIYAYLNYNGMKVTLSYNTALKIAGALLDILSIDIPMLDSILIRDPDLNTEIFAMDIPGLNELVDQINNLFSVIESEEGINSGFETIMNDFLNNTLNAALKEISLNNDGGLLNIVLSNSLFNSDYDGNAVISVGKTENGDGNKDFLRNLNINNLIAAGNIVNVNVALSLDGENQTIPDPSAEFNDALDFNSIYTLLENVINTANVGEFDIQGKAIAKIKVLSIINTSVTIDVNLKVKITEDETGKQKVLVALRLKTLDLGLLASAAIEDFESYLFFDGNLLYMERPIFYSEGGFLGIGAKYYVRNERIAVTNTEFLDNFLDYLMYLIPFKSIVTDQIYGAVNSDAEKQPMKIEKLITKFGYNESKQTFDLGLNMAELAGDATVFSGMDISLNSKLIENRPHLASFSLNLPMFESMSGVFYITVDFSAELVNFKNLTTVEHKGGDNTLYESQKKIGKVPLGYNSYSGHYADIEIDNLFAHLNQFTWGTSLNNKDGSCVYKK